MAPKVRALVVLLGLAASQLLLLVAGAHEEPATTLRDVCSNRRVPIKSVTEARRLIHDLRDSAEGACGPNYQQAFLDLEPILDDLNERLCSENKFNRIVDYHFRYIRPRPDGARLASTPAPSEPLSEEALDVHSMRCLWSCEVGANEEEDINIPPALKSFFKAWALQASGVCKQTLVDNLDKAQQLLSDSDVEIISSVAKSTASKRLPKASFDRRSLDFINLVYLPRLEGEMHAGDIELLERVKKTDLRSQPDLNRFMHACKRRFQPVYSKLVLPIVRLSKLGYEYVGHKISEINARLERDPGVLKWLALTKICEAQGNYELVESQDDQDKVEELTYEPVYNYHIEGELWIKGAEAVNKEIDRLSNKRSTGFRRFLFNTGNAGRKVVAFLDPNQFAWYRRNSNTLNTLTGMLSTTVSLLNMFNG